MLCVFLVSLYIVFFVVPARFVTKPKSSVTAYKNWDMILKCDIFGYPFPVITWSRPLKQLPVKRNIIDGDTLTIKNTAEDDGGAYVCQGVNELNTRGVMGVIWIIVKDVGKLRIQNDVCLFVFIFVCLFVPFFVLFCFLEQIPDAMIDVFCL